MNNSRLVKIISIIILNIGSSPINAAIIFDKKSMSNYKTNGCHYFRKDLNSKIRQALANWENYDSKFPVNFDEVLNQLNTLANSREIYLFADQMEAIQTTIGQIQMLKEKRWDKLSSGIHSFRSLGPEFYVACKMKKVPKDQVKVIFYNNNLAKTLNLPLFSSEEKVKEYLIEKFGVMIEECDNKYNDTPNTMFATYYMDSKGKDPETDPLGDGRAVWAGEIKTPTQTGFKYYDVALGARGFEYNICI